MASAAVPRESGPVLLLVNGSEQQSVVVSQTPFTIGRKADRNLAIPDTRVSREHAAIVYDNGGYYIVDQGGRTGVYVNGVRRERHRLQPNDRCGFGFDDVYMVFDPTTARAESSNSDLFSQLSMVPRSGGASELQQLRLFLEAARNLRSSGVLADVISTLLECSLRLTHAERGFVFLRGSGGALYLGAGRNNKGEMLRDESTISHSLLQQAADSGSEFIVGDTSKSEDLASRASIMTHDLRTVVAIPLRRTEGTSEKTSAATGAAPNRSPILGVLYLDSRFASREFSAVSQDILHAIAKEAAGLLENAHLVEMAESSRRVQQELSIAARIQQRLMSVKIPDVEFAVVHGRNLPCHQVGGDFFDVVRTPDSIAVVLADVSGKGVSAALLGSVIQGMVHSQLAHGIALDKSVTAAHEFLGEKDVGEKYATLVIARLWANGELELLNCGHIPPRLVSKGQVTLPDNVNPPVGLVPDVSFHGIRLQLQPGDRLILTTDGVVEAENAQGEYFGEERLDRAALEGGGCETVFAAVKEFCGSHPMQDDCTVVELVYVASTA